MKDSSEAVVTIIAQIFLTAKIFNAFSTVKKSGLQFKSLHKPLFLTVKKALKILAVKKIWAKHCVSLTAR